MTKDVKTLRLVEELRSPSGQSSLLPSGELPGELPSVMGSHACDHPGEFSLRLAFAIEMKKWRPSEGQ